VVNAAEDRDDRFFCAVVSNIHHDRVHRLQLRLSLDRFLLGAAGDRNFRAFVLTQACDGDANPAAAIDDHEVATFQLQCPLRWVSRRRRPQ
jgi:hypothetical protein